MQSLGDFRQFLRRALPRPDEPTATALAEVIRGSGLPESARLRELSDVAAWGVLRPEETARLDELAARDELDPPTDPRAEPIVRREEPAYLPTDAGRQWPHPEDQQAIQELFAMTREQEPGTGEAVGPGVLARRLDAIATLFGRAAKDADGWFGELLGWGRQLLSLSRREELSRLGRDPERQGLSAPEWEAVLAARASWWRERVEAALAALTRPVPAQHQSRHPSGLFWSASDPVFQSLAYLYQVLAITGEGEWALLRGRLEEAIDRAWPGWPAFTRATSLSVLRPWYWRKLERLRNRVTELVTQETDPLALRYAVERLLSIGGPDIGLNLERFLARASQVESSADMVNRVGLALGHAYLRGQGQANPGETVRQLSDLCVRIQQAPPEDATVREALIRGLLFGALDSLKENHTRTERSAGTWASLVAWSCSAWPWSGRAPDDRDRFPLIPVTAALSMAWPDGVRRELLMSLQNPFLRIIQDGTLADFSWFHHAFRELLCGNGQGKMDQRIPLVKGECPDDHLVALCRASAERVAMWRRLGQRTEDLAWVAALSGQETADLIRAILQVGSDRNYLRRELPPIIDRLGEAGDSGIATELRLQLRRI